MSEIPSPVPGIGQLNLDPAFSALCAEGNSPGSVKGILLWLVRYHFSVAGRICALSLKSRVWTTDDDIVSAASSAIAIEPTSMWKADSVQQRPGVFVGRNTWKLSHLGMFGSAMQGGSTDDNVFERQVAGAHTLFCVSKQEAEADALAWEIVGQLEGFSVKVGIDMDMMTFRITDMPPPAPLAESDKHWVVPITAEYAFNRAWQVHQSSLPFSKVTIGIQE